MILTPFHHKNLRLALAGCEKYNPEERLVADCEMEY